jgi:vacuolar-type H+-ATPase subunit C/Vma6
LYEERELKKFFDVYCMTPEVNGFIDWPEQIHNLKIRLKQGGDELLYEQPQSDVEQWPEVIAEIEQFAFHKDPFRLSTNLDKTMCTYLSRAAQFVPFFSEYYRLYFDLENIRSFFRARQFENSKEIFLQVFIPYGTYDERFFTDNLKLGYEHLGKPFFTTPYIVMIEKGCVYLEENHSFLRLERLAEEMRLGFLQQARKMTFGVEPLFTFYHYKVNEIKKIRQVYWGKLNSLPPNELKESIPDVW